MTLYLRQLNGGVMDNNKIVVIDDDEVLLRVLTAMLRQEGYEVFPYTNSIEANVHIFEETPPALIIIDLAMPLGNGDKKIELLKKHEHTKNIPIILCSGKSEQELQRIVVTTGADGYLLKPFNKTRLQDAISRVLA
jgi:DNA-binding response OmpR family regulator